MPGKWQTLPWCWKCRWGNSDLCSLVIIRLAGSLPMIYRVLSETTLAWFSLLLKCLFAHSALYILALFYISNFLSNHSLTHTYPLKSHPNKTLHCSLNTQTPSSMPLNSWYFCTEFGSSPILNTFGSILNILSRSIERFTSVVNIFQFARSLIASIS